MSWGKNAFSYLLWFVYSLASAVVFICAVTYLCTEAGHDASMGLLLGGGLLAVAGLLVFLIWKLIPGRGVKKEERMPLLVCESLAVVILLVEGILLRGWQMSVQTMDSAYFQAAMVAEGQELPQIVHGAVYFYLLLLHGICILFGNKITACVVFQMVMQLAACLLLYLMLRRAAGRMAAVLCFAFFMASPTMISASLTLSPEVLVLFLSAALLAVFGSLSKAGAAAYAGAGALAGLAVYLDVTGILLLFFLFGVLLQSREKQGEGLPGSGKAMRGFACIAGGLVSFLAAFLLDAFFTGKNMLDILRAWSSLFAPEQLQLTRLAFSQNQIEEMIVLGALIFGIFSFWCSRERERVSLWTLLLLFLGTGCLFGVTTAEVPGVQLFLVLLVILGSIGLQEMFTGKGSALHAETCAQNVYTQNAYAQDAYTQDASAVTDEMEEIEAFDLPSVEKPIQYIENPLPLPKKHEKRTLDYDLSGDEADDFDFSVGESDDFDI